MARSGHAALRLLSKKLYARQIQCVDAPSCSGHATFSMPFCTSTAHKQNDQPGSGMQRSDGTAARFYKHVGVQKVTDGYQITLDNRALKTPARNPLVLPTYALALAVAGEWEYQDEKKIRAFTMPLMSLAATAIDKPKAPGVVVETLVQYLQTDAACCRDEPGPVSERQEKVFSPVVRWAEEEFGVQLDVSHSIYGSQHPDSTLNAMRYYLAGLDGWNLTAVEYLASACRSVLTGLAIAKGRLSVEQGIEAARVEEDLQVEEWGLVEGGHDIDIADIKVRIAAPSVFLRLLAQ